MAAGFEQLGLEVTALTSVGVRADAGAETDAPQHWRVVRYRRASRWIEARLRSIDRLPLTSPWRPRLRVVSTRLRSMLVILETRHAARSLGDPAEVSVVIYSTALVPRHAALLAPIRGHWATFRHVATTTHLTTRHGWRAVAEGLVDRIGAARSRARIHHGGRFVVVGAYPSLVESWQQRLPWVATGLATIPIQTTVEPVDRDRARRQLGLPAEGREALFFGSIHPGKSPETVWAAWCLGEPPSAELIAAGSGVRASLDEWLRQNRDADPSRIHVLDGSIDEASKHLLFSAADVGICSFLAVPLGASATLADFVAYDVPVCSSSGGDPAEATRDYRLGEVFTAADPDALRNAVRTVRGEPDRAGRAAYLVDHSPSRIAADLTALLFPRAEA